LAWNGSPGTKPRAFLWPAMSDEGKKFYDGGSSTLTRSLAKPSALDLPRQAALGSCRERLGTKTCQCKRSLTLTPGAWSTAFPARWWPSGVCATPSGIFYDKVPRWCRRSWRPRSSWTAVKTMGCVSHRMGRTLNAIFLFYSICLASVVVGLWVEVWQQKQVGSPRPVLRTSGYNWQDLNKLLF